MMGLGSPISPGLFIGSGPASGGRSGRAEKVLACTTQVAAIVGFLLVNAALLFRWLPDVQSPSMANFVGVEFAPTGFGGIATALFVVAFAFGGTETVSVAAAETAEPASSVRKQSALCWAGSESMRSRETFTVPNAVSADRCRVRNVVVEAGECLVKPRVLIDRVRRLTGSRDSEHTEGAPSARRQVAAKRKLRDAEISRQ